MRSRLAVLLLTLFAVQSRRALAEGPDDISLQAISDASGSVRQSRDTYETVVRELGVSIANPALGAAETSGLHGFDVALTSTGAFIDSTSGRESPPAPWERAHSAGTPARVLWLPGVQVRKGLPLGLEAGARFSYVAFSRQTVVGGFARWGLVEGYRQWPDIVVQAGYSAYIGNDELEVGTMDLSGTIGYTIPFGRRVGLNESSFSPFVGGGFYTIYASPSLSKSDQEQIGVREVSGFKRMDTFASGYRPAVVSLGYRILSGPFQFQMSSAWAPAVLPTVHGAIGYVY